MPEPEQQYAPIILTDAWNEFEMAVYKTVFEQGPLTSAAIGNLMKKPYSTVYVILKRLEKAHLIKRWLKHQQNAGHPTIYWECLENQCSTCVRPECNFPEKKNHEKCFSKLIKVD